MMSKKLKLLWAASTFAGLAFAGCQTYNFEPVEPVAFAQTTTTRSFFGKRTKPNLMLVLDKSGSMNFAADRRVGRVRGLRGQVLRRRLFANAHGRPSGRDEHVPQRGGRHRGAPGALAVPGEQRLPGGRHQPLPRLRGRAQPVCRRRL